MMKGVQELMSSHQCVCGQWSEVEFCIHCFIYLLQKTLGTALTREGTHNKPTGTCNVKHPKIGICKNSSRIYLAHDAHVTKFS